MKELIEKAKHIVIFTHMAPDGDAMGSSLALYHWIGEKATVIVPNAFPAFGFLSIFTRNSGLVVCTEM